MPYADIDLPRFLGFGMHMSAFIYAVLAVGKIKFPGWYKEILNEGRKRFLSKSHYAPLRAALNIYSASDLSAALKEA